jgi:hypothetical protein
MRTGAEQRALSGFLVEMKRLRVELARKADDLVPAEGVTPDVGRLAVWRSSNGRSG